MKVVENGLIPVYENKNKEQLVNARELHEFLEIGKDFSTWIKDRIVKYGFVEDEDFNIVTGEITNGRPRIEYIISLEMAIFLCRTERNRPNLVELLKYFNTITFNKEIIIKQVPRLEYQFGEMLDKITGLKWEKQYPIDGGKYRLDFYLKNTLIIEYDEKHHNYNDQKDRERILYCREWLENNEGECSKWRCPVIRVEAGQELEGLSRIIKHLVGFETFDTQYCYNLDVCDYGNK